MSVQDNKEIIVAVHQPNFFPWLPYFEKILHCDRFVVLDDVQYPKSSKGTWVNRVNILNNGKAHYITAPIKRTHDELELIRNVKLVQDQPWRDKLIMTLRHQYGKAPFAKEYLGLICDLVANNSEHLADYNLASIKSILGLLDISTDKIVLSSSFNLQSTSAQRIADLTKCVGGSTYYSGKGAVSYQDAEFYTGCGIKLEYQQFVFNSYRQHKGQEFVPGLSIIDAILNCGAEQTKKIIAGSSCLV